MFQTQSPRRGSTVALFLFTALSVASGCKTAPDQPAWTGKASEESWFGSIRRTSERGRATKWLRPSRSISPAGLRRTASPARWTSPAFRCTSTVRRPAPRNPSGPSIPRAATSIGPVASTTACSRGVPVAGRARLLHQGRARAHICPQTQGSPVQPGEEQRLGKAGLGPHADGQGGLVLRDLLRCHWQGTEQWALSRSLDRRCRRAQVREGSAARWTVPLHAGHGRPGRRRSVRSRRRRREGRSHVVSQSGPARQAGVPRVPDTHGRGRPDRHRLVQHAVRVRLERRRAPGSPRRDEQQRHPLVAERRHPKLSQPSAIEASSRRMASGSKFRRGRLRRSRPGWAAGSRSRARTTGTRVRATTSTSLG